MANLPNVLKTSLAVTLMAGTMAVVSQPAQAITFSSGTAFSNLIDFEDVAGPLPTTVNGYTSGIAKYVTNPDSEGIIVTGSDLTPPDPRYRAPFGNNSKYLSVGSSPSLGGSPFTTTINFSQKLTAFGLQWGSFDTHNTIRFLLDGNPLASFTGGTVASALGKVSTGSGAANGTAYVRFTGGSGEYFNQVILSSTAAAFESDDHSYEAVPTPALLPGLIGIGVAALRRKKDEAAEENA